MPQNKKKKHSKKKRNNIKSFPAELSQDNTNPTALKPTNTTTKIPETEPKELKFSNKHLSWMRYALFSFKKNECKEKTPHYPQIYISEGMLSCLSDFTKRLNLVYSFFYYEIPEDEIDENNFLYKFDSLLSDLEVANNFYQKNKKAFYKHSEAIFLDEDITFQRIYHTLYDVYNEIEGLLEIENETISNLKSAIRAKAKSDKKEEKTSKKEKQPLEQNQILLKDHKTRKEKLRKYSLILEVIIATLIEHPSSSSMNLNKAEKPVQKCSVCNK